MKFLARFRHIFVAFSEYMNFTSNGPRKLSALFKMKRGDPRQRKLLENACNNNKSNVLKQELDALLALRNLTLSSQILRLDTMSLELNNEISETMKFLPSSSCHLEAKSKLG